VNAPDLFVNRTVQVGLNSFYWDLRKTNQWVTWQSALR
jgi:hypothetical protein